VPADVAFVVITHEARDRALATLDAVEREWPSTDADVVVVDNASTDGTSAAIAQARPRARVVRNEPGRGFAGGVNQGIALTHASAVCVMTAGTVLKPGSLAALVKALDEDPRVAAVAPLILNPNGSVQRHGLFRPRPLTAAVLLLGLSRLPMFRAEVERYYGPHEPGPAIDVDHVSGACLVFRRAALDDVGALDSERFFLYCEDVDWCIRARERGWRVRFVPSASAMRQKSGSSSGSSVAMIRAYYRSLRNFYLKHEAPRASAPIRALWLGGSHVKESMALLANLLRRRKGLRY